MPGKITKRNFRNFKGEDVKEYINPGVKGKVAVANRVTRGVTGRDNYGYTAQLEGKPRGEA